VRKSIIAGSILGALLIPSVASAQPVQSLSGDWSASNSTVAKTADGVHFGTYADGGAVGGSAIYKGFTDKLSDVSDFNFQFTYNQAGQLTGATPYGRIWLDNNQDGKADATVMFDPSLGGLVTPLKGATLTFGTADDSVRYDDDKGNSGQLSWAEVKAAHADARVVQIGVSQGYSMGTDLSAMLKSMTINGHSFEFNAPSDNANVEGKQGANGINGVNGNDGQNGRDGANGKDGVTTIIRETKIVGNTMRTVTAPTMRGAKLMSVKATMRGKKLPTTGRKIQVNLTGKTVGNYNISIITKFRKDGKTFTVNSTRNLSVHTAR